MLNILTHIEITEQVAKGGLLNMQFKDFEFITLFL